MNGALSPRVACVYHHPPGFPDRSCYYGLFREVGAEVLHYTIAWERLMKRSFRAGHALRQAGIAWYGSTWNALIPGCDEVRLAAQASARGVQVVHFLWGEFGSPRWPGLFRRKGRRVVGTFHCSARRQASVLGRFRCFRSFDCISLVSRSQMPFFIEQGVPESRLHVTPLGVDARDFTPRDELLPQDGPLRLGMIGKTERDHEFLAAVMSKLPPGLVDLRVCTHAEYHPVYRPLHSTRIMPHLPDDGLLRFYQETELVVMPLLDATSNDALLEAMACGTPVLTNRVGGTPEYVDPSCNFLLDDKKVDEWVDLIRQLARDRESLRRRRPAVRRWAEKFDWPVAAEAYRAVYRAALSAS